MLFLICTCDIDWQLVIVGFTAITASLALLVSWRQTLNAKEQNQAMRDHAKEQNEEQRRHNRLSVEPLLVKRVVLSNWI